jgi:UDP:flavonoid glycosyltransferase YjiC (YdhE family)
LLYDMADVAVVTWAPGGNLPPLLAAGQVMAAREHRVTVLVSAATRGDAERLGLAVRSYPHARDPDVSVEFERQAPTMTALAAGIEVARDVRDLLVQTGPTLAIVDCMLPAGLAAAEAAGTRTVSLLHFPYGSRAGSSPPAPRGRRTYARWTRHAGRSVSRRPLTH